MTRHLAMGRNDLGSAFPISSSRFERLPNLKPPAGSAGGYLLSKLASLAWSVICKRFGKQSIELSCLGVSFNLLIPEPSVELKEQARSLERSSGERLSICFSSF
jgi:hypothetical protein